MEATEAVATGPVPQLCNELERRMQAARDVLNNGFHLIAVLPGSKKPFAGESWKYDSRNDESAMQRWNEGIAANPAIDLAKSNLTVLDIDAGICNLEHAQRFVKLLGVPETMTVKTMRGWHFYFSGSRELPEAEYTNENISGDLKNHGYVLAAGALHPDGKEYEAVNPGVRPAPLPDVLRNYSAEKKTRKTKAPKVAKIPLPRPAQTEPEYTDRKVWKNSRHEYLSTQAYYLRKMGCEVESILAAIKDICRNRCEDAESYIKYNERKLQGIAEYACRLPIGRIRMPGSPKPVSKLWALLIEHCPVHTPVPVQKLKLDVPGFVDIPHSTLQSARKSLGIASYKEKGVQLWVRQGVHKDSSSLDTDSYSGVHKGVRQTSKLGHTHVDTQVCLAHTLTPMAVVRTQCGHVDISVATTNPAEPPQRDRSAYWRDQKRKQRARLREAKQVAGNTPTTIHQEVANDLLN